MPVSRRQLVQRAGLAGLGLLAACGRLPGQASPPTKVSHVGFLNAQPATAAQTANLAAFRQGMRDLGYVEGQNLVLDERYAERTDRAAEWAAELVGLQPEVILVNGPFPASAVLSVTSSIPIVSTGTAGAELVESGLAASHAHPGGVVTGLSTPILVGKQLQLLQETIPALSRVAVLLDTGGSPRREPFEAAAPSLGLQLQFVSLNGPEDLEPAFEAAAREHAEAIFVLVGGAASSNGPRIAELALHARLPSMWQLTEAIGYGGLMAYGANRAAMFRRAAYYVDRILKGTAPADLPVEQPMVFDFLINLKTAQALGLTIPEPIMRQATEVVQ
jgi:putative tryptophan/tyrosine transport system substrate-binding protein